MSGERPKPFTVTISNFGDIEDLHMTGVRTLDDVSRHYVLAAMSRLNGNLSETARRLGIGRTTLYRMLKRWEQKL